MYTIQVVSAASGQGLTAGTLRTHMANPNMGTTHTIKVAAGTTPQQTQAIFNALHQQQQQIQRQNARLQQTAGGLVAVSVQQPSPQQQSQIQAVQAPQSSIIVTSQASQVVTPTSPQTDLPQQQVQQQQQAQVQQQAQQQLHNQVRTNQNQKKRQQPSSYKK